MNHPQRKAWAMKHPALAKAFAIALAVMSVISVFGGVKNYTDAADENAERLRYEKKFSERITNYVDLSAQLENSISYDEAYAELEKMMEEHEDAASQHKTDLALNTAERGGNTMGANMIWEALPNPKLARAQLEEGKAELAKQEAAMQQAVAGFQMAGGDNMAASAGQGAAACGAYIAQLDALIAAIDSEPEKPAEQAPPAADKPETEVAAPTSPPVEPVIPVEPEVPIEPVMPTEPTAPTLPENPTEEQQAEYNELLAKYEADYAQYEADLAAYPGLKEKYDADLAAYPEQKAKYDSDKAQYDLDKAQYDIDKAKYDADLNAYESYMQQLAAYEAYTDYLNKAKAYGDWMTNCMGLLQSTDLEAIGQEAANLGAELQALAGPATALIDSYKDMFSGMMPSAASAASELSGGTLDPGEAATPEQMIAAARAGAEALRGSLAGINEGYSGIAYGLGMISQGLASGEAALQEAKAAVVAGEKGLHEAEAALENIWYNLGELEKEKEELAEQKIVLDEESAILSKKIMETDELRELENDKVSAKLLLTSVKEVNDMYKESDDLVGSAEKYLESYKSETQTLHKGRILVSVLAIIGGIAGLAGIPAAYELVQKRGWLIWPVLVCVVCTAAAEAVYYFAAHEMWYVGLFVAVIAALHLLVVAPQEKKPVIINET